MAEEIPAAPVAQPPASAPAPAAAPVAAPEPAAAPVAPPATPPAEAPPAETVPPAEAPAEKSLLGAEPEKKDVAPVAPPAEGDAAPEPQKEEGSQSADPAPLPTYEAFTLPEGVTYEDAKLSEFTKELAEFEIAPKADRAAWQEFGQKLVNRHAAEQQALAQRIQEHYQNAWEKQGNDWKTAFESDPEIGGNRRETTLNAALEFVRTHGGNETQQQEFRELMNATKIGNHPALIRLLANANAALAEGKPLAAPKPAPTTTSKVERRYGKQT